jgi:hypothetical protein
MTHKTKFHKNLFSTIAGHRSRCRPQIPTITVRTKADADHKFPQSLHTKADAKKIPQSQADHMWRQQISTIAAQGRKRERLRLRQRDGVHNLKLKFVGVFFSKMSFADAKSSSRAAASKACKQGSRCKLFECMKILVEI